MPNDVFARMKQTLHDSYAPYPVVTPEIERIDTKIPTRDGIRMHAMIAKPAGEGKWPVVLQRSPYAHNKPMNELHAEELAKRGYVYILVDCRGTGESEGEWEPNVHERDDGIDTVDWVYAQPWCDCIGIWGMSYGALVGWAMADAVTDKVAALMLSHYGTQRHTSAFSKRLFRHDVLTSWAMENAGFKVTADYLESCRYRPQVEVDEALWGGRLDWYRSWITSVDADNPYWQQGFWAQLAEIPSKLHIPLCMMTGWFDHHFESGMQGYAKLSDWARAHSWLKIGCWNHFFMNVCEDRDMPDLQGNEVGVMMEFFDLTLKQKQLPEQRVEVYQVNEGWKQLSGWPSADTEYTTLYLNGGALQAEPGADGSRSYVYDPENPVPTHGAESCLHTMREMGSKKQPEPNWRSDVLSFQSAPLEQPMRIQGRLRAKLYVSSDCEDTAFSGKLMEVRPDGSAYNVRSIITTIGADCGSYTPGETVEVMLDFWDLAWTVPAGCALRLDVSSSDFPQYAVHSNYPGIWAEQRQTRIANQTVHFGASAPSCVILETVRE